VRKKENIKLEGVWSKKENKFTQILDRANGAPV